MNRDRQYLYSTAIDNPEKLQSLPQHLNSSSLNHVFTHIAQEVAQRLQSSHDFPVNRDSNPDEAIAIQAIAHLQRLTPLTNKAIKHQLYSYPQGEKSNLMTQSFWFFGSRLTIVADHTTTGGQYDLIEGYFPPGSQTPPHRHTRYSEQLYVLSGKFTVWAGENKVVLSAGESFLIPVGTPHVVAVLGDKPARGLVVAAPSAFARLIAAVGTLDETESSDMELVERITAEIGDEILGAPGDLPPT